MHQYQAASGVVLTLPSSEFLIHMIAQEPFEVRDKIKENTLLIPVGKFHFRVMDMQPAGKAIRFWNWSKLDQGQISEMLLLEKFPSCLKYNLKGFTDNYKDLVVLEASSSTQLSMCFWYLNNNLKNNIKTDEKKSNLLSIT